MANKKGKQNMKKSKNKDNKNMITINADDLSMDCKRYAKSKDTSYTKLMIVNDLPSGAIARAKDLYLKSCGEIDVPIDTHCEFGYMESERLDKICEIFHLERKKYEIVHEKEQCEIKKEDESAQEELPEVIQQLILGQNTFLESLTEAIVNIGKIQAQTMKYVEEIKSMLK